MAMSKLAWLGLLLLFPALSDSKVRLAGITVGAGYAHYSGRYCCWYGPGLYPYGGFYDPFFYHPYFGTGFAQGPDMGQVKLQTFSKDAEVYLDGAYAGVAGDLKSMWLKPGAYDL